MKADSLSSRQYEVKDIKKLLDIDKNKLFYWMKNYQLFEPEFHRARGTGTRSKYSLRNLLELLTIQNMERMGFDLYSIQKIKKSLDDFNPEKKKEFNIFDAVLKEYNRKDTSFHIYRSEKDIKIYISIYKNEGGIDRLVYFPNDPQERDDQYSAVRIDIGKIAFYLKEKLEFH